jgi:glucokinase
LTFGTGMGAGLILNGKLYSGTNDMAGEVGHLRMEKDGPVGYGKAGSFEGFCSGGGIARLARSMAESSRPPERRRCFVQPWTTWSRLRRTRSAQ